MIILASQEKYNSLSQIISNDIFQNVYLYIDTIFYGYNSDKVKTYILESNGEIKLILYHYYNSLQLFQNKSLTEKEISETVDYLLKNNFNMISGNKDLIIKLNEIMNNNSAISFGNIMIQTTTIDSYSNKTEFARLENCREIAELICTDEGIGGHYKVIELEEQLIDRLTTKNCVNIILKQKNIVAHAATYADCNNISVIGGVITDKNYRGLGYGKIVVNDLTKYIQDNNKTPVLYCYNENTIKWYESLGWKKVSECAKLEFK